MTPGNGWRSRRAFRPICRWRTSRPAASPAGRCPRALGGCSMRSGKACFPKELSLTAAGRSGNVPGAELPRGCRGHDQVGTHRGTCRQQSASAGGRCRADRGDDLRPDHRRAGARRASGAARLRRLHREAAQRRTGRNPRTGEAVPVDEKAVPFFKAGKELRDRVNRGKPAASDRLALSFPSPASGKVQHAPADRPAVLLLLGAVRAVQHRAGAPWPVAHRLRAGTAAVAGGARAPWRWPSWLAARRSGCRNWRSAGAPATPNRRCGCWRRRCRN